MQTNKTRPLHFRPLCHSTTKGGESGAVAEAMFPVLVQITFYFYVAFTTSTRGGFLLDCKKLICVRGIVAYCLLKLFLVAYTGKKTTKHLRCPGYKDCCRIVSAEFQGTQNSVLTSSNTFATFLFSSYFFNLLFYVYPRNTTPAPLYFPALYHRGRVIPPGRCFHGRWYRCRPLYSLAFKHLLCC